MNITITKVLKNEVTVSGQTLSREYVENVMLPLLMAQCGRNNGAKFGVIKAFDEAGLSLKAIQEDAVTYFETKREQKADREQKQREADAYAASLRPMSDREWAQLKADRKAKADAISAHFAECRAKTGRSSGY
ncbi:hypothetical protein [Pseudomonas iridis]|uniref:hypothetical protein n=1 Tax=Pseudomonas iridis TaxID=2710587 RepID=UPI0021BE994C|nr:hypothetical protein [Pseudomonas iridis]MCT8945615.1 hypothetical protein [Pseudomonas iridis]